jgi:hypothetical protein
MATICTAPSQARLYFDRQLTEAPLLNVIARPERVFTISADRRTSTHRWLPYGPLDTTKGAQPFHIDTEKSARQLFGVPFVEGLQEHVATRFAVGPEGKLLFSCGYWDHSIKCSALQAWQAVYAPESATSQCPSPPPALCPLTSKNPPPLHCEDTPCTVKTCPCTVKTHPGRHISPRMRCPAIRSWKRY